MNGVTMRPRLSSIWTLAAAAALVPVTAVAPVTITELGTPPGIISSATAVNAAGHAAGQLGDRAVLWAGGPPIDLGALCGGCTAFATGINDADEVVGNSTTTPGPGAYTAFVWRAGALTALPPLPGDTFAIAHEISNTGVIVGYSSGADGARPVAWRGDVPEDLGLLGIPEGGGSGEALAINDLGQVVGYSTTATRTRTTARARAEDRKSTASPEPRPYTTNGRPGGIPRAARSHF